MDVRRDLVVNTLAAQHWFPPRLRYRVLRWYGIDVASNSLTAGSCFFGSAQVTIGDGTFLNVGCFLDGAGAIRIGERCNIGMEAMLCTSHHEVGPSERRAELPTEGRDVEIGNGCWLGARVTVLPGVRIAPGCVIAAGSLVTKHTDPDGLYAGAPAVRVRDLVASGSKTPAS
ncbi:MAG: acyltransferase [Solirubrobacteraceae bacterium]